ncbi:MAG: indole-3-glycerol-phosphate synthase [Pseudomonadota bacterium]
MSDFLNEMARSSAERVEQARARHDDGKIMQFAEVSAPPQKLRLHRRFSVIAEIKASSPSEGALAAADLDRADVAELYASHGASAVSVLTEPERFSGALEHLATVASVLHGSGVPAMRKDFLVDPYQVAEARIAGAGGVLLIVAMLSDEVLERMLATAIALDLFVLIECFDADDLTRASRFMDAENVVNHLIAGQILLGINTRDLRTLAVDTGRLEALAPSLPRDIPVIAESGLKVAEDAQRVAAWGYRGALVGTALMRAETPGVLLQSMISQGRSV